MTPLLKHMKVCSVCFDDRGRLILEPNSSICKACGSEMVDVNEDYMTHLIKCIPSAILCVPNPSERLRLKAVKQDYKFIAYLEQTEEMQLAAVSADGSAIDLCIEPSEAVWRKAILQNPYCIEKLQSYDQDLIDYAISITPKIKNIEKLLRTKFGKENEDEDIN
jgi:hypothetical protein